MVAQRKSAGSGAYSTHDCSGHLGAGGQVHAGADTHRGARGTASGMGSRRPRTGRARRPWRTRPRVRVSAPAPACVHAEGGPADLHGPAWNRARITHRRRLPGRRAHGMGPGTSSGAPGRAPPRWFSAILRCPGGHAPGGHGFRPCFTPVLVDPDPPVRSDWEEAFEILDRRRTESERERLRALEASGNGVATRRWPTRTSDFASAAASSSLRWRTAGSRPSSEALPTFGRAGPGARSAGAWDLRPELGSIYVPTLVVTGPASVYRAEVLERLARSLPDGTLGEHPRRPGTSPSSRRPTPSAARSRTSSRPETGRRSRPGGPAAGLALLRPRRTVGRIGRTPAARRARPPEPWRGDPHGRTRTEGGRCGRCWWLSC